MALVESITLADLCRKAMRSINAIGRAMTLDPNDLQVCADAANDMLDAWAAERLTIFQTIRKVYPLVAGRGGPFMGAGTGPYTIGPGGDFDQVRPLWIPNVSCQVATTNPPYEIEVAVLDDQEYANIAIKNQANTLFTCLWYNGKFDTHGADEGLGEIYLWMVPNGGLPVSIVFYTPTPLRTFEDLNTTQYFFPPGYKEALRYQLAIRLAPEFARPVTPELADMATKTFAVIKRPNAKVGKLRSDFMGMGRGTGLYDWRTGSSSRRGIY